jgi:nucleoside-diphosphate-sugar epimerase
LLGGEYLNPRWSLSSGADAKMGSIQMHLVTGGSGFVGSVIARRLVARGETVRVFDLWRADDLPDGVEFVQGDINDVAAVRSAMAGATFVHHNVALVPLAKAGKRYWTVNVDGTAIALQEAKAAGVRMFAHMSSSAVFGCPDTMPITLETPRQPIEIYGEAKKAGEDLVMKAAEDGMAVSIIRPRTIIGTGRLGIFQILFDWIRDGANIFVIGSGDVPFQFVHVDDLSDVSILSCLQGQPGIYNAGTDRFGTLRGDLEALCAHAGTGSRVRSLPVGLTIATLKALDKLGLSPLSPWHYLTYHKAFYFDSRHVYEKLNWRPKYSNQEMLNDSYDWFVRNFDAERIAQGASSHKRPVKQRILRIVKALS